MFPGGINRFTERRDEVGKRGVLGGENELRRFGARREGIRQGLCDEMPSQP